MTEVLNFVESPWRDLLLAVLGFGLVPDTVLHLLVLIYPRNSTRRKDVVADLHDVPRWERPFWVSGMIAMILVEAIGERMRRERVPKPEQKQSDEAGGAVRSPGGGRRVQRTVNFDREVLDRARAAASHLARNEPGSGIRCLADIVNPAVADQVAELEARFNHGLPFQPVPRMTSGRPAWPAADTVVGETPSESTAPDQ